MRPVLGLIVFQLLAAPFSSAQDEPGNPPAGYLLSLKGRQYAFQRIGTFTYFVCSEKEKKSEDCRKLEGMDLQAVVDWGSLLDKARGKSLKDPSGILWSETFVDQYGGPWTIQLRIATAEDKPQPFLKPFHADVIAAFLGYEILTASDGSVASARPLLKSSEWAAAKKELGLIPPKKKSFGDWFR